MSYLTTESIREAKEGRAREASIAAARFRSRLNGEVARIAAEYGAKAASDAALGLLVSVSIAGFRKWRTGARVPLVATQEAVLEILANYSENQ